MNGDAAEPAAPAPAGEARRRPLRVFKRLRAGSVETVRHGLGAFPVTDVYALAWFPVVSSADDATSRAWVNFYALHGSDRSMRVEGTRLTLDTPDPRRSGLPLVPLLDELGVRYDDETHLGSVMSALWGALFAPPSDPFDEPAFDTSPWITRSCGDRRSMGELRRGGHLDDLWLYYRPRKTINYPRANEWLDPRILQVLGLYQIGNIQHGIAILNQMVVERRGQGIPGWAAPAPAPGGAPAQVEVAHADYDTLTVRLLPPYDGLYAGNPETGEPAVPPEAPVARDEVNVMLLLHA
jgi:hypothetical protein